MFKFFQEIFNQKMPSGSTCSLPDGIDYHCHILPGVDDGFQDPSKSLEQLRIYEASGIREVWFTPHIMEDVPNEPKDLRRVFEDFKEKYLLDFAQRHPGSQASGAEGAKPSSATDEEPLQLHLAAENMLDALFERRLKAGNLLPLAEKYLLVETSIFAPPMNFRGLLERIRNKGYTPILAHPERYLYMKKEDYEALKAQGILFQRNLYSLRGQYGDRVQKRCRQLLKWQMYDFVGTDLHRLTSAGLNTEG